jgi:purine-binding chemotaxis protein CheW
MMKIQDLFSNDELNLLQLRADRIAAPVSQDDQVGRIHVLTTTLGQEKYAFPIEAIAAVYDDVLIIPVPSVPSFVAGVANVRGHIVSVLNFGSLVGLGSTTSESAAMLVVDSDDGNVGLRVESIGEVVELAANQMNPIPANMNLEHPEYFQGIFLDGTTLVNVKTMLSDARLLVGASAP